MCDCDKYYLTELLTLGLPSFFVTLATKVWVDHPPLNFVIILYKKNLIGYTS